MQAIALCVLCSLVGSTAGDGASRPAAIPGGLIVVASERDDLDLVARPLAGGVERVLLAGLDSPHSPTMSPDGRTVVYVSPSGGRVELFALDLESGNRRSLTNDARYEHGPSFSPDGSDLVYVSSRDCGQGHRNCDRLEVLSIADGETRELITGDFLGRPAWSPDGRRIAFVRAGGVVWVVGSDGAAPARLALAGSYVHPSWSPDGTRIVVERVTGSAKSPPTLHVIEVTTGRESTRAFAGVAPVWLASGRIRFLGAGSDLFDANPDGSGRSRVTSGGGLTTAWAASSETVVYTRNSGGRSMLYELGGDGGATRRLSADDATLPSLSPDGRSIAFVSRATTTTGVYVLPAGGGPARRVATTPRRIANKPAWSPDGTRIAFEVRGGIATVAVTGGAVAHLRGTVRDDESPAWAPGGREIAFVRRRRTTDLAYRNDVWAANVRTSRLRVVVRDGWDPAWSPDGRSIAFTSDRTTFDSVIFDSVIWTARRDGTARTRLTGGRGSDSDPVWSPGGRHLGFVRSDDGPSPGNTGLWLKFVGGGAARRISSEPTSSFTWGLRPEGS